MQQLTSYFDFSSVVLHLFRRSWSIQVCLSRCIFNCLDMGILVWQQSYRYYYIYVWFMFMCLLPDVCCIDANIVRHYLAVSRISSSYLLSLCPQTAAILHMCISRSMLLTILDQVTSRLQILFLRHQSICWSPMLMIKLLFQLWAAGIVSTATVRLSLYPPIFCICSSHAHWVNVLACLCIQLIIICAVPVQTFKYYYLRPSIQELSITLTGLTVNNDVTFELYLSKDFDSRPVWSFENHTVLSYLASSTSKIVRIFTSIYAYKAWTCIHLYIYIYLVYASLCTWYLSICTGSKSTGSSTTVLTLSQSQVETYCSQGITGESTNCYFILGVYSRLQHRGRGGGSWNGEMTFCISLPVNTYLFVIL